MMHPQNDWQLFIFLLVTHTFAFALGILYWGIFTALGIPLYSVGWK